MIVVLGVTGCIAAYKAPLILRLLQQEGIDVHPVMTRHAERFVGAVTLEALSGNRVISSLFESATGEIDHIALARRSSLLLVAPATANILGKFAGGIADDFLSTIYLSTTTPVVVAPAMNVEMWRHPATQANLRILKDRGNRVVEPGVGYQACGEFGEGRLAEPEEVVRDVMAILRADRSFEGIRVLVTAGPTLEDLDPVRFLSNRSSGRMGYALAREAARRGASVTLVSGPTHLPQPAGVTLVRVRSAAEMLEAVRREFGSVDVLVKAAAVADYRPTIRAAQKLKKKAGTLVLELEPTEDILGRLGREKNHQILVGFAAESEALIDHAREKVRRKNLDLIVANDISSAESGFDVDQNQVSLIDRDGAQVDLPRMSKDELSRHIWDRIQGLLSKRSTAVSKPAGAGSGRNS